MKVTLWVLIVFAWTSACAQSFRPPEMIVHSDSDAFFWRLFRETPPTPLLERRNELRSIQRAGYARTLTELSIGDELMALIAFVKTRLIVEYSIPHVPVEVNIAARKLIRDSISAVARPYQPLLPVPPPKPSMMPFNLDYRFPVDPWRKE